MEWHSEMTTFKGHFKGISNWLLLDFISIHLASISSRNIKSSGTSSDSIEGGHKFSSQWKMCFDFDSTKFLQRSNSFRFDIVFISFPTLKCQVIVVIVSNSSESDCQWSFFFCICLFLWKRILSSVAYDLFLFDKKLLMILRRLVAYFSVAVLIKLAMLTLLVSRRQSVDANVDFLVGVESDDVDAGRNIVVGGWEKAEVKPSATNRTSLSSIWLVFNRIPRSGGLTMVYLIRELANLNRFTHQKHQYRTPWNRSVFDNVSYIPLVCMPPTDFDPALSPNLLKLYKYFRKMTSFLGPIGY